MPEVTGPLTTTAPTDTYPTHDSLVGVGGLRECADRAARNAIPNDRRRAGMLAYTLSDDSYWQLLSSPWAGDDTDWSLFGASSGGGGTGGATPISYSVTNVSSFSRTHTFGYFPEVRLVDQTGESADIGVEYPDIETVSIDFPVPFTGTVILS